MDCLAVVNFFVAAGMMHMERDIVAKKFNTK